MPPISPMHPPLIIVKAAEDRHVLLSLTMVDRCMEATVVDNSKYLFTNAEWRSDGIEGRPQDYRFRRLSSRSDPKYYPTTLCKTNMYVIVPWHEPIHIHTIKYAGVILPSSYFKVFKDEDNEEKWHFKKPSPSPFGASHAPFPSAPLPSAPAQLKIPSHIVRGFVESAIQKKEICPITLDALVMGNVAMTSCGHLFEIQALMNTIANSNVCPNCRAFIKEEDIVIV